MFAYISVQVLYARIGLTCGMLITTYLESAIEGSFLIFKSIYKDFVGFKCPIMLGIVLFVHLFEENTRRIK